MSDEKDYERFERESEDYRASSLNARPIDASLDEFAEAIYAIGAALCRRLERIEEALDSSLECPMAFSEDGELVKCALPLGHKGICRSSE